MKSLPDAISFMVVIAVIAAALVWIPGLVGTSDWSEVTCVGSGYMRNCF